MDTVKNYLTATDLSAHQHLSCDLYLHNIYHRKSAPANRAGPSEITKAHFQRGFDWEVFLLSWLDESGLLLKVPSSPSKPDRLLENILADERTHFFIAGLSFWQPQRDIDKRFSNERKEPIVFGLAKPDLLEITKTEQHILWRVIDAKASKHLKVSPAHHETYIHLQSS